jgi:hypothetical protein
MARLACVTWGSIPPDVQEVSWRIVVRLLPRTWHPDGWMVWVTPPGLLSTSRFPAAGLPAAAGAWDQVDGLGAAQVDGLGAAVVALHADAANMTAAAVVAARNCGGILTPRR